jgi:hypothetical protein
MSGGSIIDRLLNRRAVHRKLRLDVPDGDFDMELVSTNLIDVVTAMPAIGKAQRGELCRPFFAAKTAILSASPRQKLDNLPAYSRIISHGAVDHPMGPIGMVFARQYIPLRGKMWLMPQLKGAPKHNKGVLSCLRIKISPIRIKISPIQIPSSRADATRTWAMRNSPATRANSNPAVASPTNPIPKAASPAATVAEARVVSPAANLVVSLVVNRAASLVASLIRRVSSRYLRIAP